MSDRERFTLVLQAVPSREGESPTVRRLARVLKGLLRSHGFRCLSIFPGDRLQRGPAGDEHDDSSTITPEED